MFLIFCFLHSKYQFFIRTLKFEQTIRPLLKKNSQNEYFLLIFLQLLTCHQLQLFQGLPVSYMVVGWFRPRQMMGSFFITIPTSTSFIAWKLITASGSRWPNKRKLDDPYTQQWCIYLRNLQIAKKIIRKLMNFFSNCKYVFYVFMFLCF